MSVGAALNRSVMWLSRVWVLFLLLLVRFVRCLLCSTSEFSTCFFFFLATGKRREKVSLFNQPKKLKTKQDIQSCSLKRGPYWSNFTLWFINNTLFWFINEFTEVCFSRRSQSNFFGKDLVSSISFSPLFSGGSIAPQYTHTCVERRKWDGAHSLLAKNWIGFALKSASINSFMNQKEVFFMNHKMKLK